MTVQERSIQTPYGTIRYTLYRKPVKNINLRITGDGCVHVSAGPRVPLRAIEGVILEKSQWIVRCLARQREQGREDAPETVSLWGASLPVRLIPCPPQEPECCRIEAGAAVFLLHDPKDGQRRKELWLELLRQEAQRVFVPLYDQWSAHFSKKYGTKKQRLVIKAMTSRWGSRSARTQQIALNLYLAAKPREYLEYTIVHELCHQLRMDHSAQFHQLVEENLPGAYAIHLRMRRESPVRD